MSIEACEDNEDLSDNYRERKTMLGDKMCPGRGGVQECNGMKKTQN